MMILLVTGTLERNGLREAAANLIKKVKSATAGKLIAVYGVLNGLFGAFNVGFGGVAGFHPSGSSSDGRRCDRE